MQDTDTVAEMTAPRAAGAGGALAPFPQRAPAPFFQTEPASPRGRLLLVSYHFPPGQAAGALRWQKLCGFAAERGWGLDVITLHPSSLPSPDLSRLEDLPRGVRLFGVALPTLAIERWEEVVWRGYRRLRARPAPPREAGGADAPTAPRPRQESLGRGELRWPPRTPRDLLRAYTAWLEYARTGGWARAATALARQLAPPRAVISCGPPHMAHEGGRHLARAHGVPLVIDLRDPWSLVQRLPEAIASPLWYRLAQRFERRAVRASALVVANTAAAGRALQVAYPEARERIITVMNGYDEEPLPASAPDHRFVLAYAGAIYLDRDPRPLFRAAARVVGEFGLTPAEFGIEFMGTVERFDGVPLDAIVAETGLSGFVHLHAPGTRLAAQEFLSHAQLLVSLPQDSDMAIPSKLFDYMRHPAWILALAEQESASAVLLRGTSADVVPPGDLDGITAVLKARYRQHGEGVRPAPVAEERREYSRRAQADHLFEALDHILAPHS